MFDKSAGVFAFRKYAGLIAAGAAAIFVSTQAIASTITYSESGHGTGSLGGVTFTDASITITGTGDTANVSTSGTHVINPISVINLKVSGFPQATFTGTTGVAYRALGAPTYFAGFADSDTGGTLSGILVTFDSAFGGYDLATAIGPVNGPGFFAADTFATTLGDLSLQSLTGDGSTTFSASLSTIPPSTVPEPSTWALMLLGFASVVYAKQRKARVWADGAGVKGDH